MGTEVNLSVNKLTIDWGKNNYFSRHYWLFDNKEFELRRDDYNYYDGELALSIKLVAVKNRMDALGYSLDECRKRFADIVDQLPAGEPVLPNFGILQRVVYGVNLDVITDRYLCDHNYDTFYDWLADQIHSDDEYAREELAEQNRLGDEYWDNLSEFLQEQVGAYLVLRLLCENINNLSFELIWYCHEIIENGWASLADIYDVDENMFKVYHDILYGKLQVIAIKCNQKNQSISKMDTWLKTNGICPFARNYVQVNQNGRKTLHAYTKSTFIRNAIHHPENSNNQFSKQDLVDSVNEMILLYNQVLHIKDEKRL